MPANLTTLSTEALIRRINTAPDFGYDDEAVELNRRLAAEGKTWKWSEDFFHPSVVILEDPDMKCAEKEEFGTCIHSDHTR